MKCGMRRVEAEDLIPGLPNSVISDCIIPRLAWHTRALLVATSKAWNVALQEPHIYSDPSRRRFDEVSQKGVVLLHQLSEAETNDCFQQMNMMRKMPSMYALSILEVQNPTFPRLDMNPTGESWRRRRLPPIPDCAPLWVLDNCGIACVNGKIFVLGGHDPLTGAFCARMYMLDIGAGLWRWETMPPMNFPRAFFHCVSSAGKIYAVGGCCAAQIQGLEPVDVEVYNVDTQTWELLPRVFFSRTMYDKDAYMHHHGAYFVKGANLLVTHGHCYRKRGLVRFRRAYDPVMRTWCDYECEDEDEGDDDGRRGVASKLGNVADGIIAVSMTPHHIKRVMMMQ